MKLKICGMNSLENIQVIAGLQPDYMGFIFYEKSKRYFSGILPELPKTIKKVGVFVDENQTKIKDIITKYELQAVQLHGQETAIFCEQLKKESSVTIIKAFSMAENFDFQVIKPYENTVDYFLFDAKGKAPGGNGILFDWKRLEKYPSTIPFFLSGGIGLTQVPEIKKITKTTLPIYALDINSQFEIKAGVKNRATIKQFQNEIST